jgi:diguanylate cyclase (GGDEF)-like protein/putative nucleotidyltransferase with HDIG domain
MSLGFALTFAAMLRFGPALSLIIGASSCLSGCLYPKRQPFYQLAFNLGLGLLEVWMANMAYLIVNGWTLTMHLPQTFIAIVAATLVNYAVNTGGVATIIALCTNQKAFPLWKETFLWTAPSYFAGACISSLAILLFGQHVVTILLFISPVAYLTYQSYAVYIARAEEKQQHIEEMQISQAHLADLYLATIKSLALAIDAKDQYTHQHILRVQRYAVATAIQMGLTGAELEGVNTGALLHDIGKLGVPEYVLLKPGRLTDEEFNKIKMHPEIGAAILDPVEFPWPVLPAVKYHHEKWDGTGYPDGLKGEEIPLQARILAVADVYDALTSTRSYRNAWTHERAVAVIKKDTGTHFDPVVAAAFLEVIDQVVQEMAAEGEGPLVTRTSNEKTPTSKSAQAARDIQRASSELWALYEVAQTLSSSLGLEETVDILARKLEAIFTGTACLFLLKDEEENTLRTRAAIGINQDFFHHSRPVNVMSRSLQVLSSRKIYCGEYDSEDLMLQSSSTTQWIPLNTALIVPIVHQGEALGTINLYHSDSEAFSAHDQHLLEMIAERAAMALYNGILFDRTRGHASTDPLTGVYNIRYLTQHVEERCKTARSGAEKENGMESAASPGGMSSETGEAGELSESGSGDRFALLCLDLDSFKPINDNFGHQKGDQVLQNLAQIFRRVVDLQGIVARYGGDEFIIILDGADAARAQQVVQLLQEEVESYNPGLVHEKIGALHLGVSIGYACFPHDGLDCAALLSVADSRMNHHKTERKLGTLATKDRQQQADPPMPPLRIAA